VPSKCGKSTAVLVQVWKKQWPSLYIIHNGQGTAGTVSHRVLSKCDLVALSLGYQDGCNAQRSHGHSRKRRRHSLPVNMAYRHLVLILSEQISTPDWIYPNPTPAFDFPLERGLERS
jgi:hypothetical protein